jgi:hypothetical protein
VTTTADAPSAQDRLVAALSNPDYLFDRDQVAFLMSLARRWSAEAVEDEASPESFAAGHRAGYLARVAEENAAWPPEPVHILGRWIDQVAHRRAADAAARERREGDYLGGQVAVWEPDRCDVTEVHRRHRVAADAEAGHGWFTCPGVTAPAVLEPAGV